MTQTGPATPESKAVVSRNALKHGVAAKDIVIEGFEEQQEWEELRDSVFAYWNPVPGQETLFAERIAIGHWKLRRLDRWQTARIQAAIDSIASRDADKVRFVTEKVNEGAYDQKELRFLPTPEDTLARQLGSIIPEPSDLQTVIRYEAHLHRQVIQNVHELEAAQTRRKGGRSTLARLDITGSPAG